MFRRKKLILVALLAGLVVVGSIAGVAFAQTGSESNGSGKTLLARVATILGIDQAKLEAAFAQAQREMRDEALNNRLQSLIDQGKITKEQADQYKAWLKTRPDLEPYRQQLKLWQQAKPGIPPELKEWQRARPDIPPIGPFEGFGRGWGGGKWLRGGPCPCPCHP